MTKNTVNWLGQLVHLNNRKYVVVYFYLPEMQVHPINNIIFDFNKKPARELNIYDSNNAQLIQAILACKDVEFLTKDQLIWINKYLKNRERKFERYLKFHKRNLGEIFDWHLLAGQEIAFVYNGKSLPKIFTFSKLPGQDYQLNSVDYLDYYQIILELNLMEGFLKQSKLQSNLFIQVANNMFFSIYSELIPAPERTSSSSDSNSVSSSTVTVAENKSAPARDTVADLIPAPERSSTSSDDKPVPDSTIPFSDFNSVSGSTHFSGDKSDIVIHGAGNNSATNKLHGAENKSAKMQPVTFSDNNSDTSGTTFMSDNDSAKIVTHGADLNSVKIGIRTNTENKSAKENIHSGSKNNSVKSGLHAGTEIKSEQIDTTGFAENNSAPSTRGYTVAVCVFDSDSKKAKVYTSTYIKDGKMSATADNKSVEAARSGLEQYLNGILKKRKGEAIK